MLQNAKSRLALTIIVAGLVLNGVWVLAIGLGVVWGAGRIAHLIQLST